MISRYLTKKCNVTSSYLTFIVVFSLILSGCATSLSQDAEEFMDAGHSYANYIRLSGRQPQTIETYGRVSGSSEHAVPVSELVKIQPLSGNSFSGGLYITPQYESAASYFDEQPASSPDFRLVAAETLDEIMDELPAVSKLDPDIRVVVAPSGSGVSVRTKHSLGAQRPVPITFVVSVDGGPESTGFGLWKGILETLAHELLHLQHEISPPVPKGREVDRETSAYLFGQCAVTRFAEGLGATSFELNIELDYSAWAGIESGRFSPKMEKIQQIGNPSRQGRALALGYLYHLAPSGGGAVSLVDKEIKERLFSVCKELPVRVPQFSFGLDHPGTAE